VTDADVRGWFALTEDQAAFRGSDQNAGTPTLARAEIVVTGLSARAGAARVVLGDGTQDRELPLTDDDWRCLRERLHEHLDRALDVFEAAGT